MNHEPGTPTLRLPTARQLRELEARVKCQLNGRVGDFHLSLRKEGMVLEGYAQTYHAKQIAQHAVMGACDVPICANDIAVTFTA